MPPLTEFQEKALFRALQEGLTNGIKHGKSSAFIFLLNYDTNNLRFHLQDNGTGCDKIVFGFGLSAMEYRIREVGGILDITSSLQEGCCINITIPIKKGSVWMKIKIVIADDQALVRDGLKAVLNLEEDIEVIGTADNGREAYELSRRLEPDILLLDVRMPEMDGVECMRNMKRINSATKVIMLTTFNDEEYILNAIAARR